MPETLTIERRDRVVLVRFNRPKALNALNAQVLAELVAELVPLDADPDVGCIVLTGSERAFAAGADIREMQAKTYAEVAGPDYLSAWQTFADLRTPKIAAVAGYALGGGCEVAMMCDIILAADSAVFGQPEIRLGIMPGMGGTQRLTRLVGPVKAMELILTGRNMDAAEAERIGLVARLYPADRLVDEALAMAAVIASYGKAAVLAAKEAVGRASELGLAEGLRAERRAFHALFATEDQKEGMTAFLEKRPPVFKGR